jgi:hypothetical protein
MRLGESRRGAGGRCDAPTETAILDRFGLSPCRYATDELVSAEKEGRHETSTV